MRKRDRADSFPTRLFLPSQVARHMHTELGSKFEKVSFEQLLQEHTSRVLAVFSAWQTDAFSQTSPRLLLFALFQRLTLIAAAF